TLLLAGIFALACGAEGSTTSAGDADAGAHPGKPAQVSDDPAAGPTGPEHLSETGLYSDFAGRVLAPGVVRFAPSHPLWADGATKKRYLLLPEGAKIDTTDMDGWSFPVGTKAWKEFYVDGKLVETRMLWKKVDGNDGPESWWKVAYVWNADGSDAVA